MSDLRKAAEMALKSLEQYQIKRQDFDRFADEIATLHAALAQPEPFQPDWDRVKALEESLREHMAEIHCLKALAQPEQGIMQKDALVLALEYLQLQKLYGPAIAFGNTTIDDAIDKCKKGIGGDHVPV